MLKLVESVTTVVARATSIHRRRFIGELAEKSFAILAGIAAVGWPRIASADHCCTGWAPCDPCACQGDGSCNEDHDCGPNVTVEDYPGYCPGGGNCWSCSEECQCCDCWITWAWSYPCICTDCAV